MLKKLNDAKMNKYNLRKIIFLILLVLYAVGIGAGCLYAFKNTDNMKFISYIVEADYNNNLNNTKSLSYHIGCLIKNLLFLLSVYILKYSGVLKGLCLSIPFVMGLQNSCVYCYLISNKKTAIITILKTVLLRDVAVCMVIYLAIMLVICDILYDRYAVATDMKRFSFLTFVIVSINFINRIINTLL